MPNFLDIKVELSKLDLAILRIVNDLGVELPLAVKRAARLLNAEVIRLTPPASYTQGRKAVYRDINRAVFGLNPRRIKSPRFRQLVEQHDVDAVREILRHSNSWLSAYQLVHFSPSLHTSVRDKRGRVQRAKNLFTADFSEHQRYIKTVQGRVGSTKAWWGPSAALLGNALPSWITRHQVPGVAVVDNLANPKDPRIMMINAGKGVDAISRSALAAAIRRRTVAMTRDVEQVLQGRASRYF
jgi:hypothetical protein